MPAVNEFEFRVIGPPGTGKSTYLVDQVQRRVDHWSEQTGEPTSQCRDVLLASLTKTAAAELRTRGLDIPKEQIGTLHSHALHALGKPKLCVSAKSIAQWNKESPLDHWMSAGASAMGDEEIGVSLGQYNGDRLMAEYTTNRCRLTPREDWREPVREFAKAYESWKYRNDYLDYEDLISKAYEEQTDPPGNPSTILGDEQQDSSAADLRLMRYWGSKSNKLILVGDEDQCQPAGTMIDIGGGGAIPIESLDDSKHTVCTYSTGCAKVIGSRNGGEKFKKASREYSGKMYSVTTELGRTTECTAAHKWLVKEKRNRNTWVVYIMQQGDRYRVGWCMMWSNKHMTNHFRLRCRLENADGGWILRAFNDKMESSAYEKVVAAKYGLPMICFEENNASTPGLIESVYSQLDLGRLRDRSMQCLLDHGRDPEVPYNTKKHVALGRASRQRTVVAAANLIPSLMSIPEKIKINRCDVQWSDFSIASREVYGVTVYSLEVENDHNYVANGVVTHNCIFNFRGADSGGLSREPIPDDHERVLEQSYRVPRAVHAEAMRVIERIETRKQVVYRPRDEDGRVDQALYSMRNNPYEAVYEIERLLQEPDEDPRRPKAMCIFACAYQANPLMAALKSAGIPFWNPYAKERNGFNPLHPGSGISTLDRIIAFLKNSEECYGENANVWTWEQFGNWAEMCSADGWLRHGAKTEIKKRSAEHPGRQMTVEEIESLVSHEDVMLDLADCNLEWLGRHLLEPRRGIYSYVVDIAKKRGYSEVVKNPRVVVGTCHSLKGSEAENVFVCPDLSASGWEAFGNSETRDSIYRLFYVALTRARNRLILTAPSCPQAIIL
jgi:superfamily I DNA/RNA helicase